MAKTPGQNTGDRRRTPISPEAPPIKSAAISPARLAAFEILERVINTDAHSDDLLHSSRLTALSQADRNLATALVLGVLRWQIGLDAAIRPLLARPDLVVASPILTSLRLGAFQLQHMDRIPAHAALSESVELVRFAGQPHATGMVNAILRKLSRATPPRVPLVEASSALAERMSHPAWLVSRWEKNYGRAAAAAICAFDQELPAPAGLFADDAGLPQMDEGSRLVAELAAAALPGPQSIWDCCAAPGGKTLVLAHRLPAAAILATDASPRRLRAMAERLKAQAPAVQTELVDATQAEEDGTRFDLILCDVPCTGTGTLARNPELKARLAPVDLSRQAMRQRAILAAALTRLAPGGRLVYSTCSLEPEENEQVVDAVLADLPATAGIRRVPMEATFEGLTNAGTLRRTEVASLLRNGCLRTLPGVNLQTDGFFAALMERV